jgi:hypothetical protein
MAEMDLFDVGLTFPKGMTVEEAIAIISEELTCEVGKASVNDTWEGDGVQHASLLWELDHELMWGTDHFTAEKDGVQLEIELP